MKKTKESRRVKMTKNLLKASLAELLESDPIAKVTIKKICENADVNRSTFYTYYHDQFDLLDEIENEVISTVPSINLHIKQPREKLLTEFFEYMNDNKKIYIALFKNSANQKFRSRAINKLFGKSDSDTDWILKTDITDGIHFPMLMSAFGAVSLAEKWIFGEINCTARELAFAIAKFIE